MFLIIRRALFCLLWLIGSAQAAFISSNEAALDAIYSQASFGERPIDIRIGSATELVFPGLLDINSDAEIGQIFSQHVGPANVVNFYFVDSISACGGLISSSIVGCGEYFGNDFVVESSYAAGPYGGELLAHELGHNLGLPHLSGAYLMNPFLNNQTLITPAEVTRIFNSPLVQNVNDHYWIDINPVLIVAEASQVSEPVTVGLFVLVLMMLVWRHNRQATSRPTIIVS